MDLPAASPPLTAHAPASWRAELRALVMLAAPLVAANLMQMAVYAVDVIFVSRLGTAELAAATLSVYLYNLFFIGLIGVVGGAAPVIAAELGRRKHAVREVRRSFRMALWLGVGCALPCMLVLASGERIFLLIGQDATIARRAGAFLEILHWALVPAIVTVVMRTTAAALGRPGWALGVTTLGLGCGIFGNWLLVFGNWGLPRLGLEGAAIASVVTSVAMLVAYVVIFLADHRIRRFHLFGKWWRGERERLRRLTALGLPIAVTLLFEGALFSASGFLMGVIGVVQVAAHAIALQIASISFQVPLGFAQAATIRVGMAYGAGDRVWVGRAGWVAIIVGVACMALFALLFLVAPRLLVSAYLDVDAAANAQVVAFATSFLAIAALFQLFDGAQAVAAGVLRGLQDTRVPMVIAGIGYWLPGFGTAILLGFGLKMAGIGIWIGLAVGLAVVSVLLLWRWQARERLGLV